MLLKGCGSIPKEAVDEVLKPLEGCRSCGMIRCLILDLVFGNHRKEYHGQVVLHVFSCVLGFELGKPFVEFFGRLADHFLIPGFNFYPVGPVSNDQVDWN